MKAVWQSAHNISSDKVNSQVNIVPNAMELQEIIKYQHMRSRVLIRSTALKIREGRTGKIPHFKSHVSYFNWLVLDRNSVYWCLCELRLRNIRQKEKSFTWLSMLFIGGLLLRTVPLLRLGYLGLF